MLKKVSMKGYMLFALLLGIFTLIPITVSASNLPMSIDTESLNVMVDSKQTYIKNGENKFIKDEVGVIDNQMAGQILLLNNFYDEFFDTKPEFYVYVVRTLNGKDIETAAKDIFNENKLGKADDNNGMLLLISVEDRKFHNIRGDGIEPAFSRFNSSTLERDAIPLLRNEEYGQASVQMATNVFNYMITTSYLSDANAKTFYNKVTGKDYDTEILKIQKEKEEKVKADAIAKEKRNKEMKEAAGAFVKMLLATVAFLFSGGLVYVGIKGNIEKKKRDRKRLNLEEIHSKRLIESLLKSNIYVKRHAEGLEPFKDIVENPYDYFMLTIEANPVDKLGISDKSEIDSILSSDFNKYPEKGRALRSIMKLTVDQYVEFKESLEYLFSEMQKTTSLSTEERAKIYRELEINPGLGLLQEPKTNKTKRSMDKQLDKAFIDSTIRSVTLESERQARFKENFDIANQYLYSGIGDLGVDNESNIKLESIQKVKNSSKLYDELAKSEVEKLVDSKVKEAFTKQEYLRRNRDAAVFFKQRPGAWDDFYYNQFILQNTAMQHMALSSYIHSYNHGANNNWNNVSQEFNDYSQKTKAAEIKAEKLAEQRAIEQAERVEAARLASSSSYKSSSWSSNSDSWSGSDFGGGGGFTSGGGDGGGW